MTVEDFDEFFKRTDEKGLEPVLNGRITEDHMETLVALITSIIKRNGTDSLILRATTDGDNISLETLAPGSEYYGKRYGRRRR